jgi:hypothetical protein
MRFGSGQPALLSGSGLFAFSAVGVRLLTRGHPMVAHDGGDAWPVGGEDAGAALRSSAHCLACPFWVVAVWPRVG